MIKRSFIPQIMCVCNYGGKCVVLTSQEVILCWLLKDRDMGDTGMYQYFGCLEINTEP